MTALTRRHFLAGSAAAMGGILAGSGVASPTPAPADTAPSLTFAHLTDIHVKPTGAGPEGMARCLHHVQSHPAAPAFILQGGDAIMSSLGATAAATSAQWAVWRSVLAAENSLPLHHLIGNHDCWGWQRTKAGTTGREPLYGKKWAMQELGLDRPYGTFLAGGWRFILLDSVQERGGGAYMPRLDEEQLAWLEATLRETPLTTPILIASHVPILGVGALFFYDDIVKDYQFRVAGALMHQDLHALTDLIARHPNVRVCLSGHVHLVDHVVWRDTTYLCNGAVSGSWWHGDHKGCPPGYALMRLWPNGAFHREYVVYT
jgi:3',5'-cyclic AMP phosphodiesterase CpdA